MLLDKINKMVKIRIIQGYPCIELHNQFYSTLEDDGRFSNCQSLKHIENLKDFNHEFKEKIKK